MSLTTIPTEIIREIGKQLASSRKAEALSDPRNRGWNAGLNLPKENTDDLRFLWESTKDLKGTCRLLRAVFLDVFISQVQQTRFPDTHFIRVTFRMTRRSLETLLAVCSSSLGDLIEEVQYDVFDFDASLASRQSFGRILHTELMSERWYRGLSRSHHRRIVDHHWLMNWRCYEESVQLLNDYQSFSILSAYLASLPKLHRISFVRRQGPTIWTPGATRLPTLYFLPVDKEV